jgi:hypothetical protein
MFVFLISTRNIAAMLLYFRVYMAIAVITSDTCTKVNINRRFPSTAKDITVVCALKNRIKKLGSFHNSTVSSSSTMTSTGKINKHLLYDAA